LEFNFKKAETQYSVKSKNVDLTGKTFVITGSLVHYKNRNELVETIESLGGKVSGSVSAKTDFLINNDKESSSSKNKKAKELGIKIISEDDFVAMIS
jgi:DNA ligase (NAD+)